MLKTVVITFRYFSYVGPIFLHTITSRKVYSSINPNQISTHKTPLPIDIPSSISRVPWWSSSHNKTKPIVIKSDSVMRMIWCCMWKLLLFRPLHIAAAQIAPQPIKARTWSNCCFAKLQITAEINTIEPMIIKMEDIDFFSSLIWLMAAINDSPPKIILMIHNTTFILDYLAFLQLLCWWWYYCKNCRLRFIVL